MKKFISVFLCGLMVISLCLPASASGIEPPCEHKQTWIDETLKGETCRYVTYYYKKFCTKCGALLEQGTIVREKTSPSHTYTWVSLGCAGGEHTYERRCTKCGFVAECMTLKCYGNCIEFQSLKELQ